MGEFVLDLFGMRIHDILSILEYTDEIVGITAIIITLFGCTVAATTKDKDSLLLLSKYCVAVCCILIFLAYQFNQKWCIVPNLYGRSYNDAMNSLNDAGLEGIVLLPLSNASIAEQDARVVWQSSEKDTVEVKGNRVFVVLDNNFGYEYNPLYKPLGVIDGREWPWLRNNNTVFIRLPSIYESTSIEYSTSKSFGVYTECLAATLESIVVDYVEANAFNIQIEPGTLAEYMFVGKMCAYGSRDYQTSAVKTESLPGNIFLPVIIQDASYHLYFSFYNEIGTHYDHYIPIVFIPEKDWKY